MHFKEAKSLLSSSNGINIYRGCTHGCIYCDSRSSCYQMNHDFEDIEVKINAPLLLEQALAKKRNLCIIGTGAMCDPYMHCERELGLTRKCLEIICRYGFGVSVQTKSSDIIRDLDLLKEINLKAKAVVNMTITAYNDELCRIIEPNVSVTSERLEVLRVMYENNIPTIVWMTPILPFINDTEENIKGIVYSCANAHVKGIITSGKIGVTLRDGDRQYFYSCLDKYFPKLKEKYISTYGNSYEVTSPNNDKLMMLFRSECEKHGIMFDTDEIFSYLHDVGSTKQLSLFD